MADSITLFDLRDNINKSHSTLIQEQMGESVFSHLAISALLPIL